MPGITKVEKCIREDAEFREDLSGLEENLVEDWRGIRKWNSQFWLLYFYCLFRVFILYSLQIETINLPVCILLQSQGKIKIAITQAVLPTPQKNLRGGDFHGLGS